MKSAPHIVHGFTLIELLVVVAIVAVVAGMLMPALGAVRDSARIATCLSNQRQIALAVAVYAGDNDGLLPRVRDTTAVAGSQIWTGRLAEQFGNLYPGYRYISGRQPPVCPNWKGRYNTSTMSMSGGHGYALNSYLAGPPWGNTSLHNNFFDGAAWGLQVRDIPLANITMPTQRALLSESVDWHQGSYTSYAAGHPFAPTASIDFNGGTGAITAWNGVRHGRGRITMAFCDLHAAAGLWATIRLALDNPTALP